jgi:DNA-binding transcriptional LysR family regulator
MGEGVLEPLVSEALDQEVGEIGDLNAVRWLQWSAALAHLPDAVWIRSQVNDDRVALRCGTYEPMVLAAQAGLGALMSAVSLAPGGLTRLRMTQALRAKLPPYPTGSLYLVGHRALRDIPRVAAVWSFLLEEVTAELGRAECGGP